MNRLCQVHWLARASLAFFAYHGLVPKLLLLSPGECSADSMSAFDRAD